MRWVVRVRVRSDDAGLDLQAYRGAIPISEKRALEITQPGIRTILGVGNDQIFRSGGVHVLPRARSRIFWVSGRLMIGRKSPTLPAVSSRCSRTSSRRTTRRFSCHWCSDGRGLPNTSFFKVESQNVGLACPRHRGLVQIQPREPAETAVSRNRKRKFHARISVGLARVFRKRARRNSPEFR